MRGPVEGSLNVLAVVAGLIGFTLALAYLRRRDHDRVEAFALAVFVFMQVAMWSVELFFWVTVILRLTGHGVGVSQ